MYLTEITSASLSDNYLSKVFEVHHKHKKDHPSGMPNVRKRHCGW